MPPYIAFILAYKHSRDLDRFFASIQTHSDEFDQETDEEMERAEVPPKEPKKTVKKERPPPVIPDVVEPKYVVRPRPITPPPKEVKLEDDTSHPLPRQMWLRIFGYLSQSELCLCMRVCRTWNRWAITPELWSHLDASNRKITSVTLEGIIRRQPLKLNLSHCNITYNQVKWLLARLPRLIHLNLQGNTFSSVAALLSGVCPPLEYLDISWCEGVRDELILNLLSPPKDSLFPKRSKNPLINLKELSLAGCDVTDESVRHVSRFLPSLEKFDVSYCGKITDSGVDVLTSESSICRDILREVDLSGCRKLTSSSLEFLMQCAKEPRVVIERCDQLMSKAGTEPSR